MKEYWTIIDDKHAGPFSAAELVESGITHDSMVWTQGLPDWVEASQIEELKYLIDFRDRSATSVPVDEVSREEVVNPEGIVSEETVIREIPVEQPLSASQQPEPQPEPQQPEPLRFEPASRQPSYCQPMQAPRCDEPCPPNYLVWSIIVTILCCQVCGVAAIICSCMVKSSYNKGNYSKALKLSEATQWLIIASIVAGLVTLPLQLVFNGMLAESPF